MNTPDTSPNTLRVRQPLQTDDWPLWAEILLIVTFPLWLVPVLIAIVIIHLFSGDGPVVHAGNSDEQYRMHQEMLAAVRGPMSVKTGYPMTDWERAKIDRLLPGHEERAKVDREHARREKVNSTRQRERELRRPPSPGTATTPPWHPRSDPDPPEREV
jgi:hypothetical protein